MEEEAGWEELEEVSCFLDQTSKLTDNIRKTIEQIKSKLGEKFLCKPKKGSENEWEIHLSGLQIPSSLEEIIDYINKHNPETFRKTLLNILRNSEI